MNKLLLLGMLLANGILVHAGKEKLTTIVYTSTEDQEIFKNLSFSIQRKNYDLSKYENTITISITQNNYSLSVNGNSDINCGQSALWYCINQLQNNKNICKTKLFEFITE